MLNHRPTLARRIRAGLLLAAFLVAPAGNLFGHGCTHHDRLSAGHGAASAAATAATGATGEASPVHVVHHGTSADSHRPGSDTSESDHTPCTCLGVCHGTPTPADAAAHVPSLVVAPAGAASSTIRATDAVRPDRTALRLLPFANGPPRMH